MRRLASVAATLALSVGLLLSSRPSAALEIGVSINLAPPELPVYDQPDIPAPGYIWTPGYWAWGDDGYYWVPGTWVLPPEEGYLWTPGYWAWDNGVYLWRRGYWSTEIGFYGGVNYGYGYFGRGYEGGYWDHGNFRYNRVYNHFGADVHITNVYEKTVVNNVTVNHVSFNGGNGGLQVRADQRELAAEHARHIEPVAAQRQQIELARGNPDLRHSINHGHPAIAATSRPGEFSGRGVIAAHGAPPINYAPTHTSAPTVQFNHPAENHAPDYHAQVSQQHAPALPPAQQFNHAPENHAPAPPPPPQHNAPEHREGEHHDDEHR